MTRCAGWCKLVRTTDSAEKCDFKYDPERKNITACIPIRKHDTRINNASNRVIERVYIIFYEGM